MLELNEMRDMFCGLQDLARSGTNLLGSVALTHKNVSFGAIARFFFLALTV